MIKHGPKDIFNHVIGRQGFDYNKITEEVFIGTNMCCQFGFSRELLSKGVRADISLEKNRIDSPEGVDYFFWLPTEDGRAPKQEDLEIGVKLLESLISKKIKIYIHCKNGHGRAPTLFAAYLISKGMDSQEAIELIKSKRPSVHLNDEQIRALEELKTRIDQK